jgi:hypothetical protein
VQKIEAEIDELAAELWGLTEEEIREIWESLEKLGYNGTLSHLC